MTSQGQPGEHKPLSTHLAESVRRLRTTHRIPQRALAARLEELGQPIGRIGIQRLERGERKVDLDEVVALAQVFDIPPVALLFPIGRAESTELHGHRLDPWTAAKWFYGDAQLGSGRRSVDAANLDRFREHDRLTSEIARADDDLDLYDEGPENKEASRRRKIALRNLAALRAEIRQYGLEPPAVDYAAEVVQ